MYVCASVDIAPEILEFQRTSSTVANAYVGPTMEAYLGTLSSSLREIGFPGDVLVMASSGNVMTIDSALEAPVTTATSGIAAGAKSAPPWPRWSGAEPPHPGRRRHEHRHRTDSRQPAASDQRMVHRVRRPDQDAGDRHPHDRRRRRLDRVGRCRRHPPRWARERRRRSRPACYGRGGVEATTTDAQAILGRLDFDLWRDLYGWELDLSASEAAVDRIGAPRGLRPSTRPPRSSRSRSTISSRRSGS